VLDFRACLSLGEVRFTIAQAVQSGDEEGILDVYIWFV